MEKLRKIISHPQALDQCRGYLNRWEGGIQIEQVYDTAGAVKQLAETRNQTTAASPAAGPLKSMACTSWWKASKTTKPISLAFWCSPPARRSRQGRQNFHSGAFEKPAWVALQGLSVFALRDIASPSWSHAP
jgi:hypothetical protein